MGNLSILGGSGPVREELEDIAMEELTVEDALTELLEGTVLLLTTYDNKRDKDILIRMRDTKNGKITQVTKPTTTMAGFTGAKRYWSLYDISINTLSLYPTYVYDPSRYNMGNMYELNSLVEYTSSYGDRDVAVVVGVFRNDDGDFFYTLSGEGDRIFEEKDLIKLHEK